MRSAQMSLSFTVLAIITVGSADSGNLRRQTTVHDAKRRSKNQRTKIENNLTPNRAVSAQP
jgi:hypothetical protein